MSSPSDYVIKQRNIWQSHALQLLRERACAQYARQVVPPEVAGVQIRFPEIEVALGWRVTVRSRKLPGQSLFTMLYQPEMRENALQMGLIALEALHQADVRAAPFDFFGGWYQRTRGPRIKLVELLGRPLLSAQERKTILNMINNYISNDNKPKVLVHGDLQASHLLVDLDQNSLGFIDLEAMRIGHAATNFAQLWQAFFAADPVLGRCFYREYLVGYADSIDEQFDHDVRAELALRCYRQIHVARQVDNSEMDQNARTLLQQILDGVTFAEICFESDRRAT
jgi:aminoglycoside phosphotransferase (APT) family kinase protein